MTETFRHADMGDLVTTVLIVLWVLGSLLGGRKKSKKSDAPTQPKKAAPPEQAEGKGPSTLTDILRDLERELGIGRERGPKRAPEKPPAPADLAPAPVRIERKTETKPKPQPQKAAPHRAPSPVAPAPSSLNIVSELFGGAPSLARALVLSEILQPPVSLRERERY